MSLHLSKVLSRRKGLQNSRRRRRNEEEGDGTRTYGNTTNTKTPQDEDKGSCYPSSPSSSLTAPLPSLSSLSRSLSCRRNVLTLLVSSLVSSSVSSLSSITSLNRQASSHSKRLALLLRINALNDALFISHGEGGPCATINGFRLARGGGGGGGAAGTTTAAAATGSSGSGSGNAGAERPLVLVQAGGGATGTAGTTTSGNATSSSSSSSSYQGYGSPYNNSGGVAGGGAHDRNYSRQDTTDNDGRDAYEQQQQQQPQDGEYGGRGHAAAVAAKNKDDGLPPGYRLAAVGGLGVLGGADSSGGGSSVDWMEVNAALGSCALLLASMEGARPGMTTGKSSGADGTSSGSSSSSSAGSGGGSAGVSAGWGGVDFTYTTYKIFPLCSFSKIGKRIEPTSAALLAAATRMQQAGGPADRGGGGGGAGSGSGSGSGGSGSSFVDPLLRDSVSVVYPLYTDGSFHLFSSKKSNFNAGLKALLTCLMEGGIYATSHDRTMCFPYAIEADKRGDLFIGGLELKVGSSGNAKEEEDNFRKATKFFAADLKWLVAFFTKHGDA